MADYSPEENGFKDDLSPEFRQRAAELAKEDLSTRELIVEDLQSSLSSLGFPTEEYRLLRFLRACEFRMKQATDTITAFYKYKSNNPELFTPLPPQEASDIVNDGLVGVLPGRDVQGGRVVFVKSGLWEPDRTPMIHLVRLVVSLQLKLIQDPATQIGGLRTLEDMEGLTWKHARSLSIPEIRKISKFYEEAFPARFEGFHHINESGSVDRIFTLIKPFLSVRAKGRNRFHGDEYEKVYEYIPRENLPERYGGDVTDEEIKDFTMSLLKEYNGDDFGGQVSQISKSETRVARDNVVTGCASGTYKSIDPS